jgi:predicted phosphodiesterase
MRIRFQIISDIHLEKRKYNNSILEHPIKANNLILAGDIGNPLIPNYKEYIKYCSDQYKNVFLITGNHEYWNNTVDDTDKLINQICSPYKNVYFLNNRFIDFNQNNRSIRIFGGIMWSFVLYQNKDIPSTDNNLIKDFNYDQRNYIHFDTIRNIISKKSDLIITHHAPTYKVIPKKYDNYKLRFLFASHLDNLLNMTDYWVCGHLHENEKHDKVIINCCDEEYKEKVIEI